MRKKIPLFFMLFSLYGFGQNSYFVKLDGKKFVMDDTSVSFFSSENKIQYLEVGKNWERYVKFKDLDYAIYEDKLLKSYELINDNGRKKSRQAYFVITANDEYTLLAKNYAIEKNYGRSSSINYNVFEIIIIDKQNRIIELFEGTTLPKDLKIREKIFPAISKYFSNCRDFYEKFKLVEIDNINKNGNSYSDKVITFFSGDNKINCN